jgi:hypothetical protein
VPGVWPRVQGDTRVRSRDENRANLASFLQRRYAIQSLTCVTIQTKMAAGEFYRYVVLTDDPLFAILLKSS